MGEGILVCPYCDREQTSEHQDYNGYCCGEVGECEWRELMTADDAFKHCAPNPNGTYDLIPYLDTTNRTVRFEWGNSLLIKTDPTTQKLASIVGREFKDVHPERIKDLMQLPTVRLKP